ncbi:MAG: hypothetical protein PHT51_00605 [Patescibacteria group bacterium]|nr:hypothetical protein [Patescibacteria group bacterium]MDD4610730.1 hypothetical protein [Patescibacteria group bacterium]
MPKVFKQIFILLSLVLVLVLPYFVFAETPTIQGELKKIGGAAGYEVTNVTDTTAAGIAGSIINVFLGLLGIIFIALIIYAGFNWMTAGGEEEKVKNAQETIKKAVIGLVIVVSSYAIYRFIFEKFIVG